jgi:hypothetical protein
VLEDTDAFHELATLTEGLGVRLGESFHLALDTRALGVVDVDRVTGTDDLTEPVYSFDADAGTLLRHGSRRV